MSRILISSHEADIKNTWASLQGGLDTAALCRSVSSRYRAHRKQVNQGNMLLKHPHRIGDA